MENSNLMNELPHYQFISVNITITIFNKNTWSAHERVVSAWNATLSLTTLAARIRVHNQTEGKRVSFIFYILSCSKHEPELYTCTYHVFLTLTLEDLLLGLGDISNISDNIAIIMTTMSNLKIS